jgi:putative iron-regulated protein
VTWDCASPPNLDQYPAAEARIEATVAGNGKLSADALLLLGANERGFFTIEYLLWGDGDNDAVLAAFTGDGSGATRRRAYLRLASKDLATRASQLLTEWEPEGGNYLERYLTTGLPDSTFDSMKQAISMTTSNLVFASEDVSLVALGDPLGKNHGGEPKPDFIRGWRSDNAAADMQSYLLGIRNMYNGSRDGTRSLGLGVIVQERNPTTHAAVEEALDAAIKSLAAMPRPLRAAVEDENPKVEAAYDANAALTRVLATDVIAALGATLSPSDNDGD